MIPGATLSPFAGFSGQSVSAPKVSAIAPAPLLPDWPEYSLVDNLLPTLRNWQKEGKRAVLATLVATHGSSPRPIGSEMAVSSAGDIAGYVSGGCVEGAVAHQSLDVLRQRTPRFLDYGAGSPVMDIQLACGGRIGVFAREISDLGAYTRHLSQAARQRQALCVMTCLATGAMRFSLEMARKPFATQRLTPADWPTPLPAVPTTFWRFHAPPVRLVLAGNDAVTLALVQLAPAFGFVPFLLRPLGPQTPPPGLPPDAYDRRPLAEALADLALDQWTAVYSLTHDAETDHQIACAALRSTAFCIGILGSKSRIGQRLTRLRAEGFDAVALGRLRLPAGLALPAHNPTSIALAILAETCQHAPPLQAGFPAKDSTP